MNFKFWNAGGGKSEGMVHVVKNVEVSATILAGQPAIFVMNGTDDGLAVVLPSTAGATKIISLAAGVAVKNIEPGKMQNVQVYGYNRHTKILRATRALVTDVWAANAGTLAVGDVLIPEIVNNAWVKSAAAVAGAQYQVVVAVAAGPYGALPANYTTGMSANGLTLYEPVKTFIRMM